MGSCIRYNSGRVACESFGPIVEATYSGVLTARAFDALRADAIGQCANAGAFVVRLDRAAIAMEEAPAQTAAYSANDAAGVWIVRPDQYEFWLKHAMELASHGVMRAVWLESHSRLAYEWALRQSAARRAGLPQ